jgi:hypothetical protein
VSVALASYKLRFHDEHVRAVPARDEAGCVFSGHGADLRAEGARTILSLATPFRAWVEAHEPGAVVRSLSVDLASHRVLITLESNVGARPRVVRIDPPHSEELLRRAAALEAALGAACADALGKRTKAT